MEFYCVFDHPPRHTLSDSRGPASTHPTPPRLVPAKSTRKNCFIVQETTTISLPHRTPFSPLSAERTNGMEGRLAGKKEDRALRLPLVDVQRDTRNYFRQSVFLPSPLLSLPFFLSFDYLGRFKVSGLVGGGLCEEGLMETLFDSPSEFRFSMSSPPSSYPTSPLYSPPLPSSSSPPSSASSTTSLESLRQEQRKSLHIVTPLIYSPVLSSKARANVYLKLEQVQPSGSFKNRRLVSSTQRKTLDAIFLGGIGELCSYYRAVLGDAVRFVISSLVVSFSD